MASRELPSVIRRSSRGRTGIDVKTKTDSGCFVDDDVEKQSQVDKSPPRNKSETNSKSVFFSESLSERNKSSTLNRHVNNTSQNAGADEGEMSHSDELLNYDDDAQDDSQSTTNSSIDNSKPKGDFYCLYYSDSPNGSLTRNKYKEDNDVTECDRDDIEANVEKLLLRVKSEALKQQPDSASNEFKKTSTKSQPPAVAPKPKRDAKTDPILDELEKLGASVGRDYGIVDENDSDVFNSAVKQLQVAKTTKECLHRFDEVQSALLANVPDTLERKKTKNGKEEPRKKSLPGADRTRKLSDSKDGSKTKDNKIQESPKTPKKKFEVRTYSRTEIQSLQLMKEDSHHKRSHMNSDVSKSFSTRPDSYKASKTDSTKRLADKKELSKDNYKKNSNPQVKSAKIGKKVITSSKREQNSTNGSSKRKRMEFRSSKRRLNGDLSSIPEDGIIGVKIDDLDNLDSVIPLAKGEEDLSSGEDDLDIPLDEEVVFQDTSDLSYEDLDLPSPPPITDESTVSIASVSTTKTTITHSSTNATDENNFSSSRGNAQRFESGKEPLAVLLSQPHTSRRQHVTSSSDGWTSESTAGYSSANDADDEIDRQPDLETSEDFETYEDPEEIADMTFGTVIDGTEGDDFNYTEASLHQLQQYPVSIDRRPPAKRTNVVIERRKTFDDYKNTSQEASDSDTYTIQSDGQYKMNVDSQCHYEPEYYENDSEAMYYCDTNMVQSSFKQNDKDIEKVISYNTPNGERQSIWQRNDEQRSRKKKEEKGPDPSGFMTVEDIKRLIFKGKKPSVSRSSSFCGAPSSLRERALEEQESFQHLTQRQSWSGYSRRQQQQAAIDPLVREVSQRNAPPQGPKKSPYVRTVIHDSRRQHDFYSDSDLAAHDEKKGGQIGRSQSFSGAPLQRRANSFDNCKFDIVREGDQEKRLRSFREPPVERRAHSFDNHQLDIVREEDGRERRFRSFSEVPVQRRTKSLENYHLEVLNNNDAKTGRSRSLGRPPMERRANSLDEYCSSNRVSSSSQRRNHPKQHGQLFRSPSDSSSDYSQSDNEQHRKQFPRTNFESARATSSPVPQYIDTHELVKLLSPQIRSEVQQDDPRHYKHSQSNSSQQNARDGRSTFPRHSSESLRIQAIRRASQTNSDSDSDALVDRFDSTHRAQPSKRNSIPKNADKRPTLSERFSEVPQRITLDELAEQLNLPSDDEEEDIVDGGIADIAEPEFENDLEFDFGDYFDDNNMIVGEALRLKKVLGCDTKQDPELETIVSVVTDPNIPKSQNTRMPERKIIETDKYLTLERPPPYHEVKTENSGTNSPNHLTVYDTDGSYLSESDHSEHSLHSNQVAHTYVRPDTLGRQEKGSDTQTVQIQGQTGKAISTEELLKLLINSSQRNLSQVKSSPEVQQTPQALVKNLLFPAPQTKAASTGNIHSEKTFPGHVHQMYGNMEVNGDKSNLNRRRRNSAPKYHKSHESLRKGRPDDDHVLKAKLVSSSENCNGHPNNSARRVFEEEVDCMRTKGASNYSSGEISSSSSLDDVVVKNTSPVASVAYVGCEETKAIETLPRVKLSSQRKRRKEKVGFLSDQDIPTYVHYDDQNEHSLREISFTKTNASTVSSSNGSLGGPKSVQSENAEEVVLRRKPTIDLSPSPSPKHEANACVTNGDQVIHFPHDNLPSPNSVNVFIDYKKKVMTVTSSTPKIHHGKLITDSPTNLSPVSGSPTEEKKQSPKASIGHEEFPPRYDSGSSSERSSSVYSSDDEKFFGSCDTVVFVDRTTGDESDKPNVDVTSQNGQNESTANGYHSNDNEAAQINVYSARVDSLLQEVRSSLDLDSIGSDLLDQAMERVKDKLSPRSPNRTSGDITMEAYVALHQADELQAIINEIKGELQILQEENSLLKETVVSLQHGESQSTSEATAASFTESAERIESIRRQIAAVVVNKQATTPEVEDDLINIDIYLRGFGESVGSKLYKKNDVKLGQVTVKGGADWTGVYDAAKSTFLDHIKRIDPSSCLGLGPTSMYGAQIGATMLTPETLRKKNPRVEISRKFNSCVIQLKDGMTDCFDTLIYDTLIPKPIVESLVHQVLEHRFVVLCGSVGIGKTHLATKLAEHLAQRFGSKSPNAVLTLSVGEKSRKELKKTLANLMKCDISTPQDGVPVVVILDQLDCLASLADIFEPKQLDGNRNSPFIIGVRNKSKKGPFSSKELAIHKYFRWIQMSVYDRHVLGLLERFLRRKLSWSSNIEEEEDLMDLFIWLTQVWQRINQILLSYIDVEVTIGPSVFFTCPMDIHASEGWFANVWNYTIIPYLHQNIRNSKKIYERDVPWEDPTKWVIMRWPWNREKSKVLPTLKKLRQVDIVLNRNHMDSANESKKESRSRLRRLRTKMNVLQSPSKAGSLESWSTADWEAISAGSDDESIASSTL